MNNKYDIEQLNKDIEALKDINKTYQERIDNLNYIIGNLLLEYPTMFVYQKGEIYLNKNFDFEKSFVTKQQVVDFINLLRELSRDLVDNETVINDVNKYLNENKRDDN